MIARSHRLAALVFAAATPSVADPVGLVEVGDGRRFVECRRAGSPAVVIVAGGKASADHPAP